MWVETQVVMMNELGNRLTAISLLADMHGHELLPWLRLPDGRWQTFCGRCLNTVWLERDVLSFLPESCPIQHIDEASGSDPAG